MPCWNILAGNLKLPFISQDLNAEKEKFNEMCAKLQKDLQDLQATLYEESQKSLKLSMELDTKVRC